MRRTRRWTPAAWLCLLAVAGCPADPLPLRLLGPRAANAGREVELQAGLVYAERGGQVLRYDLYKPLGATDPLPLVIMVHGGSWRSGSRDSLLEFAWDIAAHGYLAAAIDYRLVTADLIYPAPVADVLAAVRFFREQAGALGADPSRIALFGMSAGAHLALLAGLAGDVSAFDPALAPAAAGVRAVVDLFGPADFTVDPSTVSPSQVARVERFLGRPIDQAADLRIQASPVTYVRADGPAVLIIHGDADRTVPVSQSRTLAARMELAGQRHVYIEVAGMDHISGAIWYGEFAQSYRAVLFDFLARFL